MAIFSLAASLLALQAPEEVFFDEFRAAIGSGVSARIVPYFAQSRYADYLFESGARRGMRSFKAHMIPAPPGRQRDGAYWMIISARQDIEEDHDLVFPVVRTGSGLKLGPEIQEWEPDPFRISHQSIKAELFPAASKVNVESALSLLGRAPGVSVVFRLGLPFTVTSANSDGNPLPVYPASDENITRPSLGSVVKVGGVIIVWSTNPISKLKLSYNGVLQSANEDKINSNVAFITAWWTPSIGRLPFTTDTTITGPTNWTIVSEGEPQRVEASADSETKTVRFECKIPISYPKIVAGKYKLAAEIVEGGRAWRSYQLDPIEPERAQRDVVRIRDAVKWFEANIGKYPFSSYSCFDADTYYGIESYSYTLLQRDITTKFIGHELGHTYFGGLVPSAYTKDTWNEGVTQYVDSVLFQNNADRSLEAGLQTWRVKQPLSAMNVAHANQSATYYRGAYVLRMLENEIGRESMLKALRRLVETRRGIETTWLNIRSEFEQASGRDLKGFWEDWITNGEFPLIAVTDARVVSIEGKPRTWVTIRQSGPRILKMKFKVVLQRLDQRFEKVVELGGNQTTIPIDGGFAPMRVGVDVFGLSLAQTAPAFELK